MDSATEYQLALVTTNTIESAKEIAEALVSKSLAACVNIFPKISSVYQWKGKVENDSEVLLLIKTKKSLIDELEKAILKLHSYDCPEILTLDLSQGTKDYLSWLGQSLIPQEA